MKLERLTNLTDDERAALNVQLNYVRIGNSDAGRLLARALNDARAERDAALARAEKAEADTQSITTKLEEMGQAIHRLCAAMGIDWPGDTYNPFPDNVWNEIKVLKANAARLREALEAVEWVGDIACYDEDSQYCPWCFGLRPDQWNVEGKTKIEERKVGHAPDCQRQSVLAAGEGD